MAWEADHGRKYGQHGLLGPPWMVVQLRASLLGESFFLVQGKVGISEEREGLSEKEH